ncbi:30S ribosomal protein S5 alanine N-acetyltransferase [Veronia nyctiphanis]|uniref:[Ribosomal protein uS5]-alanine N-acetyltransferase n=1 Tax=Veronia nyctiphanis TaxID=1278244 RepID=A0A4Q0YYB2_9GAMM|nr:GNAT family N-acetyltransferase [Veronia nyctiphanis]RXJ74051.1 30S ribosomal protein S5 alanine N-acetyltransferase [Veronia nyctiphanis]
MLSKPLPCIVTKRTRIEILPASDANLMCAFYAENKAHLAPWSPLCDADYYTENYWRNELESALNEYREGTNFKFVALNHDHTKIVGVVNFTGVIRGVFNACFLGYAIDDNHQQKGLMTEMLTAVIAHMFEEEGLHRIMANYMPANIASERVLTKLNFEHEGYARDYLKIAGKWEDHVLTALINDNA